MQMTHALMAENEEELKSLLIMVKEQNEGAGIRLNVKKKKKTHDIWPHYCMANRRRKCGSSDRFSLLGHKNHCR